MLGKFTGLFFALLIFISSLLGSIFLLFPYIPLAKFFPKQWRFVADRFVGLWLTFPAALLEKLFGCRFKVTGDLIQKDKAALIIMNHRTRLDWLFLWNALYKMDPWLLTTEKISLKADLKKIPGAGWAMSCASFLFLNRRLEADMVFIQEIIEYYAKCGSRFQMLLFPEGTDRGERATQLSHAFADKNSLPRYNYVLHPRTTGFNLLLDKMEELNYIDCIYDITLAYDKEKEIVASEMDLLRKGRLPKLIHFDVKEYKIEELPANEEGRSTWLNELWQKKEEKLKRFYQNRPEGLPPSGAKNEWPMSENTTAGVIQEVVKDLVEDVTMFLDIQDEEEGSPATKRQRLENGTNGRTVSIYSQQNKAPTPLTRRDPHQQQYPEDRSGSLLNSYVPAPGHIAMVHPLHNVIIEVPQDLPILLQGPAISEGSGRGEMEDPERLQRIENVKAQIARQLEYARDQEMAYELRSEEENEPGPSGL